MIDTVLRYLRRIPVALGLAGLTVVVAIVTGGFARGPLPSVREVFGTGLDPLLEHHNYFSPITSVFLVSGLGELIVVVIGLVTLVGIAERLMGWWRTLVVYVVSAVIGAALGIGLQALGLDFHEVWSVGVKDLTTLDPFTPIAGTIMAASAFAGPLWRRRIRVLGFSILVMFLLYSGQPGDLFRLLSALVGFLLGLLMSPGRPQRRWQRSSHSESRGLLAAVLVITAVGPLITVFSRAKFGPLHSLGLLFRDVLPHLGTVTQQCRLDLRTDTCLRDFALARLDGPGPVLLTLMPLLVLLIAALGILQGKRFSAWLAISVNVLLAVLAGYFYGFIPQSGMPIAVVRSRGPLEAAIELGVSVLVPLIVALLIFANLRHLTVSVARRVAVNYTLAVAIAFALLSSVYLVLGSFTRGEFRPRISLGELITDLPQRFVPVGFLGVERIEFVPTGTIPRLVYQWIGPAFWLVVLIGAIAVLTSVFDHSRAEDRDRARELLVRTGGGSLGFMTTWVGNRWWFTDDGAAAVAYRVVNGVAVTTSEPVCTADRRDVTVRRFATFCDDNGWIPVFYSVHDEFRQIFAAMGWRMMLVGEETVLRPATWSMKGRKWQDIRSSINRAERGGIRAEWTSYARLPLHMSSQIEEISEQWVAEKGLPELGFTLGGLNELKDPDVAIMLAVGPDDWIEAVTSWMPCYRGGEIVGWTLDFMRRRPDSMNGVMEFLIASAVIHMQTREIEFMSLSAAPLAQETRSSSDRESGMTRLLAFIGAALEPVYGFRSLLRFKQKFQPEYRPLFMAYADPFTLPTIGTAIARAYLPTMSMSATLRFMRSLG
ncbi:MAG: phosphatidylglycerol lysyltransferase domain-containing protein [Terrimesophilobacter sp.]